MDGTIDCKKIEVEGLGSSGGVRVELTAMDSSDIGQLMTDIGAPDVVELFDNTPELLDAIGEDAVRKHFDIKDPE